jgi:SWI/SNF-related matrix-associated actin-dependent regulator of chromatin subfamily A member 5
LEESEKALATKKNGKGGKKGNARTRKSEKQEDAELVAEEDNEDDTFVFTESPACKLWPALTGNRKCFIRDD